MQPAKKPAPKGWKWRTGPSCQTKRALERWDWGGEKKKGNVK